MVTKDSSSCYSYPGGFSSFMSGFSHYTAITIYIMLDRFRNFIQAQELLQKWYTVIPLKFLVILGHSRTKSSSQKPLILL